MGERLLWYSRPAANWNEALPLGNGELGAMQFGGVMQERFCLNHDTLWSGRPLQPGKQDKTEFFLRGRALVEQGDAAAAQRLLEKGLCGPFGESYLPMGELLLEFSHGAGPVAYRRELDLQKACTCVEYTMPGGARFVRRAFISRPARCMVMRLTAHGGKSLSFALRLRSELHGRLEHEKNTLLYLGECPSHVAPPYVEAARPVVYDPARPGIGFCFAASVATDGELKCRGKTLYVEHAGYANLYLCAETSFRGYDAEPSNPQKGYRALCLAGVKKAALLGWRGLYHGHIREYGGYAGRCSLTLKTQSQNRFLPTDERLKRFGENNTDVGLAELLFHYGRYLLISSSRPDTQPANLQGIWNEEMRAPWCSNFTLNINTEMNYWPAFSTNLTECAWPLIQMVEELQAAGARAATDYYGARRGFVAHHNTDLWRFAAPVGEGQPGSACYGLWPLGAVWLCRTVYEYYEYTLDAAYLESTGFPLMENAAAAFDGLLKPDTDGRLYFCPATSPENSYGTAQGPVSVARWSAMTQELLYDLFSNCAAAARALENPKKADRYAGLAARLKLPLVGPDGRLLEWERPVEETEPHHRHISHLYGLYPGCRISPEKTPQLAEACKKSLEARGDEGTGWSLAWKLNQWARLGDGEHAWRLLCAQLRFVEGTVTEHFAGGGSYPNLFCAHPPFQIDGNFGAAAGMVEMIIQARSEEVLLLPALPRAWPDGALLGVCTPGGLMWDVVWKAGRVKTLRLFPQREGTIKIVVNGRSSFVCYTPAGKNEWHF
ncbi:glycosyl hydrolase family 95 catalytic domain-containing protein [Allofournierella sp.]|uniref:glycosyl hydrolase family 95 catalytic domain-containing protein n=1 Tax=Allofournierella sp. TaxID=1940256 RepID=UPI003AB4DC64